MSIAKKQLEFIESGEIELGGTSKSDFKKVELNNIQNTLENLAAQYSLLLAEKLNATNSVSSGDLSESIQPTSIEINGSVFTVGIQALKYASFIDEGVDGWANSRGSRFKFKSKGMPQAAIKNIAAYLEREGKMNQLPRKYAVVKKEAKDWKLAKAESVAYMIKRMGIKATHFWRDATKDFEKYLERELGTAVRVDIIKNIVK